MINQLLVYRPGIGILQAGEVVELQQGDTLLVSITLQYKCSKAATCHVRGLIGSAGESAVADSSSIEVSLPASEDFNIIPVEVPIPISAGGSWYEFWDIAAEPGTYNLGVFVEEDPDVYDLELSCIIITEKPGWLDTIMALLPMFLLIMMMGMIMPMMATTEKPKEVE